MSKYKFSKPYAYKNMNLFKDAIFSDAIFNDCGSSVYGKCENVENLDECLDICNNSEKCFFGYFIDKENEKICVPLNKKYHDKSIGPYYKLRNKNVFPVLKNAKTTVFINKSFDFPPQSVNTIFYTDTLILKNTFSKKSLGIQENNVIVSDKVLSSFPVHVQFLPKIVSKALSLKYVPVKNGDEVIINIPRSSYILKEKDQNIYWVMRLGVLESSENTFHIFTDKKKIGENLHYSDTVYFKKNEGYVYIDEKLKLGLPDQTIFFQTIPAITVYYCDEFSQCKSVGLVDTISDRDITTYKGRPVFRNPICWSLCHKKKDKYKNSRFLIVLLTILTILTVFQYFIF